MSEGPTLSEALRQAIRDSGLALAALERETGVQRMSIGRFMRGERSLRLDKADRLAAFLGLELRPKEEG
jgi:transcriptional regulator with XRE-family HTH domain